MVVSGLGIAVAMVTDKVSSLSLQALLQPKPLLQLGALVLLLAVQHLAVESPDLKRAHDPSKALERLQHALRGADWMPTEREDAMIVVCLLPDCWIDTSF